MTTQYSFVTNWKIDAPVEKVWDAIYNSTEWSIWWKGVLGVKELDKGNENGIDSIRRYTWESVLPYKLSFNMRLTEYEYCKKLAGVAFGELEGNGTWLFKQKDNITYVSYYWNVITTKPWMNYLTFILKPAFRYNHDVVMSWGEKGLKRKLGLL